MDKFEEMADALLNNVFHDSTIRPRLLRAIADAFRAQDRESREEQFEEDCAVLKKLYYYNAEAELRLAREEKSK